MTETSVKLIILTNLGLSWKCGLVCLRVKYVTGVSKREVLVHILEQTLAIKLLRAHVVLVPRHYRLLIGMQSREGVALGYLTSTVILGSYCYKKLLKPGANQLKLMFNRYLSQCQAFSLRNSAFCSHLVTPFLDKAAAFFF